ncbi:MAG: GTP 3',8-cyclase MoaA [Clostridia bacterium]|nr:GTP 3',8-cyclase MoaA [Clostridia bacterium]
MIDNFGRDINYLRVSVTQRCNLRCVYCGTEIPDAKEISANDISKIVSAFAKCGITKVRLTGGEPLVRKDIVDITKKISNIDGIKKIAITTNGVLLSDYAKPLQDAGISVVNISLDSLNRERYKKITGFDLLPTVLESIDVAEKVGMKIRVNTVLIKGENEDEAEDILNLAKDRKIDVRFIELMPFSDTGSNEKLIVTGDELIKKFDFLEKIDTGNSNFEKSVARYYKAEGFKGRIGFINPISDKFCDGCNRIRLLSDGKIRPCLGYDSSVDIMPFIDDEEKLTQEIEKIILSKPNGHSFNCEYGNFHAMNKIGG